VVTMSFQCRVVQVPGLGTVNTPAVHALSVLTSIHLIPIKLDIFIAGDLQRGSTDFELEWISHPVTLHQLTVGALCLAVLLS